MTKEILKLKDSLYKYLSFNGFAEYVVIGIKTMDKGTLYEVECQSCNGHDKCTLYVIKTTEKGQYRFVSMTNNNGEDDRPQHYWHDDDYFYDSLSQAKKEKYLDMIGNKKEEVKKVSKTLDRLNKELNELQQHYSNI